MPDPSRPRALPTATSPRARPLDAAWPGWSDGVAEVVAADGGLLRAWTLGLEPAVLVGDLDSLQPADVAAAADRGVAVVRASTDKDESDAELAALEAVRRGATRITVLGAFGGPRLDHALANVWLLAHPGLAGVEVVLLDARWRASLDHRARCRRRAGADDRSRGRSARSCRSSRTAATSTGITTEGLRYPLRDEPLVVGPARGLSNVRDRRRTPP